MRKLSFRVRYDSRADVLYLSTEQATGSKAFFDTDGIVWRYDPDGTLVGATIMDLHDRWDSERAALVTRIARRFDMPPSQAASVLQEAFAM